MGKYQALPRYAPAPSWPTLSSHSFPKPSSNVFLLVVYNTSCMYLYTAASVIDFSISTTECQMMLTRCRVQHYLFQIYHNERNSTLGLPCSPNTQRTTAQHSILSWMSGEPEILKKIKVFQSPSAFIIHWHL